MENDSRIIIIEDIGINQLLIYWKERRGSHEIIYNYDGEHIVEHTREIYDTIYLTKPFIALPLPMGHQFIALFCNEIEKGGLNSRKIDMQAGKVEIMESELKFHKDQLVKFIDHFTKQQ